MKQTGVRAWLVALLFVSPILFLLLKADLQGPGSGQTYGSSLGEAIYNPIVDNFHVLLISCISGLPFSYKLRERFTSNMLTRTTWPRLLARELLAGWSQTVLAYSTLVTFYYLFITFAGLPLGITFFSRDPLAPYQDFYRSLIIENTNLNGLLELLVCLLLSAAQMGVIALLTFTALIRIKSIPIALFLPWLTYQIISWFTVSIPTIGPYISPLSFQISTPGFDGAVTTTGIIWIASALALSGLVFFAVARNPRTLERLS